MPRPRKQRGEPVTEYLTRLTAGDPLRIRVHPDYIDSEGNVVVKPVLICGQDTSDDYRPARMDTSGRLDVTGVCPTYQPLAELDQATPADDTYYTVLDTQEYCRLIAAAFRVNWTGAVTTLRYRLTIDGEAYEVSRGSPASGTWYYATVSANQTTGHALDTSANQNQLRAFFHEGRSIKVEVKRIGGTADPLQGRCVYALW